MDVCMHQQRIWWILKCRSPPLMSNNKLDLEDETLTKDPSILDRNFLAWILENLENLNSLNEKGINIHLRERDKITWVNEWMTWYEIWKLILQVILYMSFWAGKQYKPTGEQKKIN